MKINSISGFVCYVKDLAVTAKFYETLGFRMGPQTDASLKVYVNWYAIEFKVVSSENNSEFQKEAQAEQKGSGLYIMCKVDDVDEYYEEAIEAGLKPSSQPRDWPWGNREFVIRDPDGYKLVFFQKK